MTRDITRHGPRPHHVEPLPQERLAVLDLLLAYAKTVPVIHGLLEVDVTRARERLAQREGHVTFTAFIVASVARAAAPHPIVNSRRAGRKLVSLHPLDLVVTAEYREDNGSVPLPHGVHDADRRTWKTSQPNSTPSASGHPAPTSEGAHGQCSSDSPAAPDASPCEQPCSCLARLLAWAPPSG